MNTVLDTKHNRKVISLFQIWLLAQIATKKLEGNSEAVLEKFFHDVQHDQLWKLMAERQMNTA